MARAGIRGTERKYEAMLEHLELIIFGLLVAVAGLVQLSRIFGVPYPVFLVLGGLPWVSGMSEVQSKKGKQRIRR